MLETSEVTVIGLFMLSHTYNIISNFKILFLVVAFLEMLFCEADQNLNLYY